MSTHEPITAEFLAQSPEQTGQIGALLGRVLWAGDYLALHGQLGAGKTALVRGLALGLGLDTRAVSSPTFVIAARYTQPAPGNDADPVPLVHADAYRLTGPEDLDSVGFDALADGSGVVAVEWAERLGGELERWSRHNLAHATLTQTGEHTRRIELTLPGAWARRPGLDALLSQARACSLTRTSTRCPVTGQRVAPDCPTWPFATAQARLVDLGRWLSGRYVISRELKPEDEQGE